MSSGTRFVAACVALGARVEKLAGGFSFTEGPACGPEGERIANIETPEAPTNVSFCGEDRKTLFITARQGLYAIKMNERGY